MRTHTFCSVQEAGCFGSTHLAPKIWRVPRESLVLSPHGKLANAGSNTHWLGRPSKQKMQNLPSPSLSRRLLGNAVHFGAIKIIPQLRLVMLTLHYGKLTFKDEITALELFVTAITQEKKKARASTLERKVTN